MNKRLIDSIRKWIHTNVDNEYARSIHLDELANYNRDQKYWLADSIFLFRDLCASAKYTFIAQYRVNPSYCNVISARKISFSISYGVL